MDRIERDRNGLTRRQVGRAGLGLVLAVGGVSLGWRRAFAADEPYVTDVPESAAIVQALQYVSKSAKPDQQCASCALFVADAGATKGKCALFAKGLVSAEGWCSSWSKKSA